MPYKERVRISQSVKYLGQDQLGNLVKLIEEKCPQAYKENDDFTCHIFVDNIPKSIFKEISEFIEFSTQSGAVTKKLKTSKI